MLRHLGYRSASQKDIGIFGNESGEGRRMNSFPPFEAENDPIIKQALVHRAVSFGAEVDIEMYSRIWDNITNNKNILITPNKMVQ